MKLEKQKEVAILSDGESQESIKMSLDLESAQVLMQMLSKNLYSDAIGSTIRETASNALDSHRKAKTDKPILVSFQPTKDGNYEFTVEDFGTGLDDDEVRSIISKYGKSTKRDSSDELGMMGLGFKAPLAYTSSFYFVTRKDGIERKYMMYEGEDVNTIDLLYQTETKSPNGLKVIVPVKSEDRMDFVQKMKEQLAYFESVYFNVATVSGGGYNGSGRYIPYGQHTINNGFKILRSQYYQHSELTSDPKMHICLDNVYYPIDWHKLGIPELSIPIGIRFTLTDGVFPTPNRENIRYTTEAKDAIMKKIKLIANTFVIALNRDINNTDDVGAVLTFYTTKYRNLDINGNHFDVSPLFKYASVPILTPKINGVKHLKLDRFFVHRRDKILCEYRKHYYIDDGSIRQVKNNWGNDYLTLSEAVKDKVYVFSDIFTGKKKDYVRDLHRRDTVHFVKKSVHIQLWPDKKDTDVPNYFKILELNTYPRKLWREVIKEFHIIQSFYTKKFENLDKLEISQSWIDARKKQVVKPTGERKAIKLKGEIIVKKAKELQKYMDGRHAVFESATYKIETLSTTKAFFIYTHHDDFLKLDALYPLVEKHTELVFITFSGREMKLIADADIHNLIPYDKFMEGKNKPFRRIATSYLIHQLITDYQYTFTKMNNLKGVSTHLHSLLKRLDEYHNKYYVRVNTDVSDAFMEVAKQNKLWDDKGYSDYLEAKAILERLPFIEELSKMMSYSAPERQLNVLKDLFRFYKHRMDASNYEKKVEIHLNDEEGTPLGELDEDEVKQLTE